MTDAEPDTAAARLAKGQQQLLAAITGTGAVPAGFDADRVELARRSLLAKRSGEVRAAWPALAADIGTDFGRVFAQWAAQRPTRGSLQDGWLLARERSAAGLAGESAALELALREARSVFDGVNRPRRRRGPFLRRPADGVLVLGWGGRVLVR